jgi:dTDP-4-amino-4,6-dideoxygalactose transaminase
MNSRMDTIQAAVLIEKLKIFKDEIDARNRVADRYAEGLSDLVKTPTVLPGGVSVWAQYTIELPDDPKKGRDALGPALREQGVPTAVYYPIPLSQQKGYRHFPAAPTPVSASLSKTVISLPMHPYLEEQVQDYIIASVHAGLGLA